MSLLRATVTTASPVRVRVDGAAADGPAEVPTNVAFATGQRVVVELLGRSLVVIGAYSVSSAPVGQSVYLSSPDGSVWRLTVSNSGTLGATKQ